MKYPLIATVCAFALSALPVNAEACAEHAHHTADAGTSVYAAAMDKMHKDMMTPATGDADIDFARQMIPHHEGAVDMAKILLEHGKDPELRKMAQEVITAQEAEITFMREWLKKHDPAAR